MMRSSSFNRRKRYEPILNRRLSSVVSESFRLFTFSQSIISDEIEFFSRNFVDSTSNERLQVEINGTKKTESESIIRGMLGNPMKTPVERMNGFTNSPFSTPTNFQENQNGTSTNSSNRKLGQINNEPTPIITTIPPSQAKVFNFRILFRGENFRFFLRQTLRH